MKQIVYDLIELENANLKEFKISIEFLMEKGNYNLFKKIKMMVKELRKK